MIDSSINQLQKLRQKTDSLLKIVDEEFTDADWRVQRKRKRRRLAGEIANDDPAERPVEL